MRGGFSQQDIEGMTVDFRAGAHWFLYAETLAGPDGLPSESLHIPRDADPAQARAISDAWKQGKDIRSLLFPED